MAVILSAVAGHWEDFGIILVLLLANAIVGFWEEYQAGNAIDALKARLAIKARVRRGGKWTTAESRELVPGDVIRVRLGDIVPADARLLAGDPVEVDQFALTGESLPVERKPGDTLFSGSIVRQGEIDAMVYATGQGTYFGKTAQLVQEAHIDLSAGHRQRVLDGMELGAINGQGRKPVLPCVDPRSHFGERRHNARHGTLGKRFVASDVVTNGCAARMPESIRMVEPELPASSAAAGCRKPSNPRP